VNSTIVSSWINKFKREGVEALKSKKQGRPEKSGVQPTGSEQVNISKRIIEKDPQQLKLEFALWTREAVGFLASYHSSFITGAYLPFYKGNIMLSI